MCSASAGCRKNTIKQETEGSGVPLQWPSYHYEGWGGKPRAQHWWSRRGLTTRSLAWHRRVAGWSKGQHRGQRSLFLAPWLDLQLHNCVPYPIPLPRPNTWINLDLCQERSWVQLQVDPFWLLTRQLACLTLQRSKNVSPVKTLF